MTTARSGIPTTYRYSNMRSRLEARWAAFFDLVGWSWTYEPFDTGAWIPDFLIEGAEPFLVEVGPCATWQQLEVKAAKVLGWVDRQLNGEEVVGGSLAGLVVGASPNLIGSVEDGGLYRVHWARCGHCSRIGWRNHITRPSAHEGLHVHPCGHDHLWDGGDLGPLSEGEIDDIFGQAGSETQWHP